MVKVLLSLELADMPPYVAKDLSNIPPLSAFDNDVIGLHKEIDKLKSNFDLIIECRKDISNLVHNTNDLNSRRAYHTSTETKVQCTSVETQTYQEVVLADVSLTVEPTTAAGQPENIPRIVTHESDTYTDERSSSSGSDSHEDIIDVGRMSGEENDAEPQHGERKSGRKSSNSPVRSGRRNDNKSQALEIGLSSTEGQVGLSNKPQNRRHQREYNARTNNDQISAGTGQSVKLRPSQNAETDKKETHPAVTRMKDTGKKETRPTDTCRNEQENTTSGMKVGNLPDGGKRENMNELEQNVNSDCTTDSSDSDSDDNPGLAIAHTSWHQGKRPRHQPGSKHTYSKEYSRSSSEKQDNKPLIGSGSFTNLKTANHKTNSHATQGPNRTITGVFLSRLHKKTSPENIAMHIRREINMTVKPEKLQAKYDGYSSFFIRCHSAAQRRTLMDTNLWQRGTLIKSYYS
jgi:hypothetical protein